LEICTETVHRKRRNMNAIFANLPEDIVRNILSYQGAIKYRAGKYMDQLSPNDPRYELLRTGLAGPTLQTYYTTAYMILTVIFPKYRKIHKLTIRMHNDGPVSYHFESTVQCDNPKNLYIRK